VEREEELVHRILQAAHTVHAGLGPGFIEGIYARALAFELKNGGLQVDRERTIKIWYGTTPVGKHRLDLLVEESVIVELKASRSIIPVHVAQMNSYLRASTLGFGLVLNFGTTDLQWEIVRSRTPE
jgi:GxxExxY protein